MASVYVRVTQLFTSITICLLAALIGSIFTTPAIPTWYAALAKPELNPPAWVFGPVWTVLYILMGIALYLVWSRGWGQKNVRVAMAIFGIQLVLNVLWSYLFFGLQAPYFAFLEIVLLWIAILMTIAAFYRVSVSAAVLLVPYLLWVSFAAYLNYGIYVLNP
ncbi:TspO/MBR family protein [Methanoculleus oceani]|uniref:TspO protein n=1 Tax=Methanoculleus oceani TaxID=2184756 RepID=A0ABD4TG03_9EURY|nr:TspO protein [Methanoculleus sp. CWC-02]